MLELQNIYKTFNPGTVNEKRALNGVSLKLEDGDFVTVIGGKRRRQVHDAERHCRRMGPSTGARS